MTKLIGLLIIVALCWGGYGLFRWWESVENAEEERLKEAAAAAAQGDTLPGMSYQLSQSYQIARRNGGAAMREWLKNYGHLAQDPRKAWIEMEYAVAIARDDPAEARRVFKAVKARTPEDSPIRPRVKQLEKSFE